MFHSKTADIQNASTSKLTSRENTQPSTWLETARLKPVFLKD